MNYIIGKYCSMKRYAVPALLIILFLSIFQCVTAQELPPRPVGVTVIRDLGFGAFACGFVGGSVTISSTGSRSASGDVILLNMGYSFSTALFQLVANPGTVISILNGPDISLSGSNGGTMLLHIGSSDPASPFVITTVPPASTLLNIGGKLTVGNSSSNPPGSYSGTFNITFIQE